VLPRFACLLTAFFEEMFGTGAFHIIEKAVEPERG